MNIRNLLVLSFACGFMFLFSHQAFGQSPFQFYAVYDWLIDDEHMDTGMIGVAALSADGKKIAFANGNSGTGRKVYMMNPDGSALVSYPIPSGTGGITSMAMSRDGSRVFFLTGYDQAIYKLENGAITKINLNVQNGPGLPKDPIRTTATGDYVYFVGQDTDLWRVGANGSAPVKIIDDAAVPRDSGPGNTIWSFAISEDASTIAFTLWGYYQQGVGARNKFEVFCLKNGNYSQLTNDGHVKDKVFISGDGSTIVYPDYASTVNKYISIGPSGGAGKALANAAMNFTGQLMLTKDGGKMFYNDGGANGGRLVDTANLAMLDLMPWKLYISIFDDLSISEDGSHFIFRYQYAEFPFKRCLIFGHLNDVNAGAAAAVIKSIRFSPYAMSRGNANAIVKLLASVSDPDGSADIKNVVVNHLINGITDNNWANVPAHFYFDPLDSGTLGDEVKGDGVYTSEGKPGGKINQYSQMTIRVGVKDGSNHYTVADVVLPIADVLGTITLSSPNGGENWKTGTKYNITWTQSGLTGDVTIDLYKGVSKHSSIGTAAASAGTFAWTLPANLPPGNDYKIRIFQGSLEDFSNAAFTISLGTQNRRYELVGTWSGSGVYYLNSDTSAWTKWSSSATMICAGDVDGDGLDDLVGVWPSSGIWVRFTATQEWKLITASLPNWLAVGDVTGDGKADIVGLWGETVYGRDSATGAWYTITAGATMGVGGDLDGDGRVDVIGVWPSYGGVFVRYAATGQWAFLCSTPDWIETGDMNGDGKDDLIGIWGGATWVRDSATTAWTQLTSGASKVWARDFDGDGKADLVGIWSSGIWVKYSSDGSWKKLSSPADWIALGRFR